MLKKSFATKKKLRDIFFKYKMLRKKTLWRFSRYIYILYTQNVREKDSAFLNKYLKTAESF